MLAVNSVQSLFNYYTEQLENTPSLAEIQATNKLPEKKDDESELDSKSKENLESNSKMMLQGMQDEKEEEKIIPPLYKIEFVLTVENLVFKPDLDSFRDSIGEIMQQFKETLLQVENLVPDKYFDAFTR